MCTVCGVTKAENDLCVVYVKDLEGIKSDLSRKMSEMESGVKLRAVEQEKKAAGDMRKLQKDCQAVRKDKEDLSRTLKVIENDLRRVIKDVGGKKAQSAIKKLVEGIEGNRLVPRTHEETSALRDLEELAAQFEDKCGEAHTWKSNFEKLQVDFGERTSELESLNSQLHRAKQVR